MLSMLDLISSIVIGNSVKVLQYANTENIICVDILIYSTIISICYLAWRVLHNYYSVFANASDWAGTVVPRQLGQCACG